MRTTTGTFGTPEFVTHTASLPASTGPCITASPAGLVPASAAPGHMTTAAVTAMASIQRRGIAAP